MSETLAVSIDIGSTCTKGGLFEVSSGKLHLKKRLTLPTTQHDLTVAFEEVLTSLRPDGNPAVRICCSSSAKGGLSIVACGLVPELTAKVAKQAALSAGGKVVETLTYRLSAEDVDRINDMAPDIVLLAGGTDGGNESYLVSNAKALSKLRQESVLIYAGNCKVQADVREALGDRECFFTDNILPDLDSPAPEPARDLIRTVFLDRIVEGKGLSRIAQLAGARPNPTPFAVLNWVERAAELRGDIGDFVVVDMGGATTDVYSSIAGTANRGDEIRKGLPEPRLARTVEGDLGMRIGAPSACVSLDLNDNLRSYAKDSAQKGAFFPADDIESELESSLAQSILDAAMTRHAGNRRRVFTSDGQRWLVQGRDISGAAFILGAGGFLPALPQVSPSPADTALDPQPLLPASARYARDEEALLPLAANLSFDFPESSVSLLLDHITEGRAA